LKVESDFLSLIRRPVCVRGYLIWSEDSIGMIRKTAYNHFDNFISLLGGETPRIARLREWFHSEERGRLYGDSPGGNHDSQD